MKASRMKKQPEPLLEWRLAEALGEPICALGSREDVRRDTNAMIYQVPEVMNRIYEMLISTSDAYAVSYFYGGFVVYTKDSGMGEREA